MRLELSIRTVALGLGPLIAVAIYSLPTPAGLSTSAWHTVAITSWMIVWWLGEALPLWATSLLPIPFMPLLGITDVTTVLSQYTHPLIFLFLGGFMVAGAMQKSGLHKRIALKIIGAVGTNSNRIIAGFMLATAFLSMWISNTATTVMMYAVAISMIGLISARMDDAQDSRNFSVALMLGIAYSASIGGVGTLIGTPPNALLANILQGSYKIELDFVNWMMIGVPVVLLMLPLTWLVLTRLLFRVRGNHESSLAPIVEEEIESLGRLTRSEGMVAAIFAFAAIGWIFGKPISALVGVLISDTAVAMTAAALLFVLPLFFRQKEPLLDWHGVKHLPWGILVLLGGGLAVAAAFNSTGLAKAISEGLSGIQTPNIWIFVVLSIALIVALTEVTSNTSSAATFLPILGAISIGLGHDPRLLMIPITLGASMAFMTPVATAPNAIVFSYERVRVADMVRAGLWLNPVAVLVCFGAFYVLAGPAFGIWVR